MLTTIQVAGAACKEAGDEPEGRVSVRTAIGALHNSAAGRAVGRRA